MEKKDLSNLIDAKHSNIINNENDTNVINNENEVTTSNNENVMNGTTAIDEVDNHAQEPELPVEFFLKENYEFRYNVLSDKTEVRGRGQQEWHHLDKKRLNSIAVAAYKAMPDESGLKTLLTDIIYSEATPAWNPVEEWLASLPEWDRKDRVSYLFGLIPGLTSEQRYWLSVWLRSMVAHWRQMDGLHGNESVPTLIGEQGCGKSTFCQRLLPEHLREYYLDHVNLGNKFDKEMALTNNLIVNLDEMDQIRASQQAELKQMLSKVRVNGRPIYGREQSDRLRFASFVATTNNRHPLRDRTGSRRFICIEVPHGQEIGNSVEIDYEQLYAQVLHELERGERYWFTSEETRAIQRANTRYQSALDLDTMVETCFRQPNEGEFVKPMTAPEMLSIIAEEYPTVHTSHQTCIRLGLALQRLGFRRHDGRTYRTYYAVPTRAA